MFKDFRRQFVASELRAEPRPFADSKKPALGFCLHKSTEKARHITAPSSAPAGWTGETLETLRPWPGVPDLTVGLSSLRCKGDEIRVTNWLWRRATQRLKPVKSSAFRFLVIMDKNSGETIRSIGWCVPYSGNNVRSSRRRSHEKSVPTAQRAHFTAYPGYSCRTLAAGDG